MASPTATPAGARSRIEARTRRMRAVLVELRKRLPLRHRLEGGVGHGLMSAVAAVIAYLPPRTLSLREGHWAAMTAIAVVQTELGATRSTARDQFTGAFVGGLIGVAVVLCVGQHLVTYALAVLLSILACWVLNVASAARLAGTTATIILLVPHPGSSAEAMMGARVLEVGWGVSVAVTVVWLVTRLGRSRLSNE